MCGKLNKHKTGETKKIFDSIMTGKTYATKLYDLFDKDWASIWDYIKEGREFWVYDDKMHIYRLITITYIRSGIAFYKLVDDPSDKEYYIIEGSLSLGWLYPRIIYVKDMVKHMQKTSTDKRKDIEEELIHTFNIMVPDIPSPEVEIDVEY